jgi:hypothetical protein
MCGVHYLARFFFVVVMGLLAGCGSLIEQTENLGTLASALSFQKDSRSGVTEKQAYAMYLLGRERVFAPPDKSLPDVWALGDAQFKDIISGCTKPSPFPFFEPGTIVAAGNLAYGYIIGQVQGRIKKLKEESHQSYMVRRTWYSGSWQELSCIVIRRGPEKLQIAPRADLSGTAGPIEKKRSGALFVFRVKNITDMVAVKKKDPQGRDITTYETVNIATALKPIYVRLDDALAVTAVETAQKPASVRVDIGFTLNAITVREGKYAIAEVAKQTFKTMSAKLEQPLSACADEDSSFPQPCEFEGDLFINPTTTSAAIQLTFAISESGSALSLAESAEKSLEVLNKQLFKPTLDQALAELTKGMTTSQNKKK